MNPVMGPGQNRSALGTWAVAICLAAVALPAGRCAQSSQPSPQSVAFKLDNLGWLAGTWEGSGFEGRVEEHWTAPEGESMAGLFRLVVAGRTRVVQLMTLAEDDPGLVLNLNHFTPHLQRWEEEKSPVRFLLTELTADRAVFSGLSTQESLPGEIVYQRPGSDTLVLEYRSRGETTQSVRLNRRGS